MGTNKYGGVGSKTVIEIEARSVEAGPRGVQLGHREHMDVLGYHMQTIIPDFRRLVHAQAQMQCCWLSANEPPVRISRVRAVASATILASCT